MTLQLGDLAPDFTVSTTTGQLSLHHYLGEDWGLLFSHPKDFTPVCTSSDQLGSFESRLLARFLNAGRKSGRRLQKRKPKNSQRLGVLKWRSRDSAATATAYFDISEVSHSARQ